MDDFDFKFKNAKVSALKQLYGDLKPEFQDGGSVTTPKRGLVDEPGSYAGKPGYVKPLSPENENFLLEGLFRPPPTQTPSF